MHANFQQPRVSIIMPTYNRAELISDTINSIRNQTYTNWELIIIDDGSTDDTSQVVERYKDDRILFLEGDRTGIVGRLKNTALQHTTGSLIAFIDSDDLWHASKLEKQVDALRKFPEAGFCLVNGYNFRNAGQPEEYFYKQKDGIKEGNVFIGCFQSQVSGYTQALLVRKECIATAGNFKEDKTFSDFEFIIALAYHFNAVILYEPLVFRRIHQNNYIHSTWVKSMDEGIQIIRNHRQLISSKLASHSLFRIYIDFGEKYLEQKQYWNAFRQFNKAWINKPLTVVPAKKMAKTFLKYLRGS
jgi:glycosyltransferase involved in cell wall biosynthesis